MSTTDDKIQNIANGLRKDYWKKVHLIKKYLVEDKLMRPEDASKLARQLINDAEGARLQTDEEYMKHAREEYASPNDHEEDFWDAFGIKEPEEILCFEQRRA